ncbi:MAG: hypothetical protein ROY82_11240 [Truepera sp.]|nr:hypothetical protein [Truepera sp.]HRQ09729.1 hypothetical protein [Trueperaceae bacterium]
MDERVITRGADSWTALLYRNDALHCGRPGNFTFAIIEPKGDPLGEAPLWVYLHGGGIGYYNDETPTRYIGIESENDEESLDDLLRVTGIRSGRDTLIARRLNEGWRVLVPSMCDHDLHAGEGTTYPNNPNYGAAGDTVDGLLANEAALTWVTEHRETTWVVIHGTSAGSVGAFALSYALHEQGIDVNAAILDAYLITPRLLPYMRAGVTPQVRKNADFDYHQVIAKVGRFADVGDAGVIPERVIAENDFRAVPLLDVVGDQDQHCAGEIAPFPETNGANNCVYVHAGFAAAVDAQTDSPHAHLVVPGGGHTTTKKSGTVHDQVDAWLEKILTPDAPQPFG